jgi:SAM-dependent methyltransferase
MEGPRTEAELVALALALGAPGVPGMSEAERALAAGAGTVSVEQLSATREALGRGGDPLGDAFCQLRPPEDRRRMGATYTPDALVAAMVGWAGLRAPAPERVVDPGCGSGRFLVAAGRRFPEARLIGVEVDPLAALIARAHLAAAGLAGRGEVLLRDYRELHLPPLSGRTLFLGNPPYVRHHRLEPRWKRWLTETARERGLRASQLSGLHVHFFLATARAARPGDLGVLVTAAEWLDVNYGRLVRELLLGALGAEGLHLIEPTVLPFSDAATTAVITCFQVGARPPAIGLRRVETFGELGALEPGPRVERERLEAASRWTPLTRAARKGPEGYVELGELCRVHRGQVTGANDIWITGPGGADLPEPVLFPAVTRARELFDAGPVLADPRPLRRVIDLPVDLEGFGAQERERIERFLEQASARGAERSFIARHRKAWWSVGLKPPAPILATYMARRPPAFVLNPAGVRHINIAHGLYPREPLSSAALAALARHLSHAVSTAEGRTYAGGLTKFEPKEMERLRVPGPALLASAGGGETTG